GAGSDLRSMTTRAERDGEHYVINGRKHFISHADVADYVILFAASGIEETRRGTKKKITAFLVDKGMPGFEVLPGYDSVTSRLSQLSVGLHRLPRAHLANPGRGASRLRCRQ